MPRPYSEDLRVRVVNRVKSGDGHQRIADDFRVGVATLRRWIKLYKDTGALRYKIPFATRPRKVDYDEVQKFIEKNPDKTLKEIGDKFGVTDKAVLYITKQLNITYKKTLSVRGAKGRFTRRISKNLKSNTKRESDLS